jgi:hypothetical protein
VSSGTDVVVSVCEMNKVEVKKSSNGRVRVLGAVTRDACATPLDRLVYGLPVGGVL